MELTVRPLQLGRQDVVDEYELLLNYFPILELEPVSREVLLDAVAWRACHGLRTPYAILLATRMRSGITAAVAPDDRWRVSASQGIETILLAPGIGETRVTFGTDPSRNQIKYHL